MTQIKARNFLIGAFFFPLVLEAGIVFSSLWLGAIGDDDTLRLLTELLSVYSVHFAVILGFQFSRQSHRQEVEESSPQNMWLALLLVSFWNLLILSRFVIFLVAAIDTNRSDSPKMVISFTEMIAHSGSFLVVGALAFYFGKSPDLSE